MALAQVMRRVFPFYAPCINSAFQVKLLCFDLDLLGFARRLRGH